ncbi:MAG: hypothetical protein LUH58_04870 [Lachnospiraceae bacterium]|nr:hypothetical protein [Lachnospiraceae bacterium]
MATTFVYDDLKTKYGGFVYPVALVKIEGEDFASNKAGLAVSDIEVEMTSGFEASIATFWIYNSYDQTARSFRFDDIKSWIYIGSSVTIGLGYDSTAREIFQGFISGVRFVYPERGTPGVEVTAMDVKGIMMSGTYSKQLTATTYSAAVKEILEKTAYAKLKSGGIISSINITDTPDKSASAGGSSESDRTIEMVCESDYEFVVKAAKKFNYEFFTVGGDVYFRKARSNTEVLIELGPEDGFRSFEIGYDITGLVETVEVRGMDAGKSKAISQTQKLQNKISQGSKAKALLSKSEKVYIDPTVASATEAGYRADYLASEISYRFGTLEAELIGLPEMTVGRFIEIKNLGTAVSNTFYVVNVRHIMDSDQGYVTRVTGKAASMK